MADPEIPILVYDDEWLNKPFRARVRNNVPLPRGVKITEENMGEYSDAQDLTGKTVVFTIRKEKGVFTELRLTSDLDGVQILEPTEGYFRLMVDKSLLQRMIGVSGLFYTVTLDESGVTDRRWSGSFEVRRR